MNDLIIDKNYEGLVENKFNYKLNESVQCEGNLKIVLDKFLIVDGYIEARGSIKASRSIKADESIKAGGSIKADESIEAGGSIKAGGFIEAGWSIKAGGSIKTDESIEAGGSIKAGGFIEVGWSIKAGGSILIAKQLQTENERLKTENVMGDKLCPIGQTSTCGYWAKQQKQIVVLQAKNSKLKLLNAFYIERLNLKART